MSTGTTIEWTHMPGFAGGTWNTVNGCTPVSEGCRNCYAASFASRGLHSKFVGLTVRRRDALRDGEKAATRAVFNGVVWLDEESLTIPLRRKRPTCWFVNSMSDTFHEKVPFDFIDRKVAVAAMCPQHRFLFLTKRPERMAEYLNRSGARTSYYDAFWTFCNDFPHLARQLPDSPETGSPWPLPNVWLGTSVENQETADARIPHLLRCHGVRFVSVEPQLGPISLEKVAAAFGGSGSCKYVDPLRGVEHVSTPVGEKAYPTARIDWLIQGGESGPGARPFDVTWARSIRDQCKAAGVPYFFKQAGSKPFVGDRTCTECDGDGADPDTGKCTFCFGGQVLGERFRFRDKKGGNPAEWPEDLRNCREWPVVGEVSR